MPRRHLARRRRRQGGVGRCGGCSRRTCAAAGSAPPSRCAAAGSRRRAVRDRPRQLRRADVGVDEEELLQVVGVGTAQLRAQLGEVARARGPVRHFEQQVGGRADGSHWAPHRYSTSHTPARDADRRDHGNGGITRSRRQRARVDVRAVCSRISADVLRAPNVDCCRRARSRAVAPLDSRPQLLRHEAVDRHERDTTRPSIGIGSPGPPTRLPLRGRRFCRISCRASSGAHGSTCRARRCGRRRSGWPCASCSWTRMRWCSVPSSTTRWRTRPAAAAGRLHHPAVVGPRHHQPGARHEPHARRCRALSRGTAPSHRAPARR
jgi:hypothetical protein